MDKKWLSYEESITFKKSFPWRTLVVESLYGPVIMRVNNETGQAVPYRATQDTPKAKDVRENLPLRQKSRYRKTEEGSASTDKEGVNLDGPLAKTISEAGREPSMAQGLVAIA
ncbi:hypothetical protein S40285_10051 [Stachybotrys chlorohalonatus IBT 40285]|uniref:Uncharacterized protein n=1 Tax=Stachybotrys chlorohalonatus (strain IBT 40285) TaxID=1283841 RepID=A0A084QK90_STAC4|nr:hypothetical protein S40285_10051 [Stachybotrys chlorohalonata IBT 40285]